VILFSKYPEGSHAYGEQKEVWFVSQ